MQPAQAQQAMEAFKVILMPQTTPKLLAETKRFRAEGKTHGPIADLLKESGLCVDHNRIYRWINTDVFGPHKKPGSEPKPGKARVIRPKREPAKKDEIEPWRSLKMAAIIEDLGRNHGPKEISDHFGEL